MLTIEKTDNGTIRLTGRFDESQSKKAIEEFEKIEKSVTIDMSGLDYISSSGLSVLVQTYKRLNDKGEKVKLTNLNSHIRDIFSYTRLDQIFEIE